MKFNLPCLRKSKKPPHFHDWKLVTKTTSDPKSLSATELTSSAPQDFWNKLIFGVTTYVWECACGEIRTQECLGTEESPLGEVLNRVDAYGSQQVSRNGKNYMVVPHASNANQTPQQPRIPLRKP